MLANFFIGLREGLEAALVVGILVAYLVKLGHKNKAPQILIGTIAAVLVSVGVGFLLTAVVQDLPSGSQELISGITSIVAVVFVTWMIFWMARQSRNLGANLRGRIDVAIERQTLGLATVAFLAVIREGIETSAFIWSAARATGTDTNPLWGAALGIVTATVLGYLIYRGALKLNLGTFFKYTGAFLVIVAAGILAYGIGELQEIGVLPFLRATTYDLTGAIAPNGWVDNLLRGTISFKSAPTQLESIAWFGYLIIAGAAYLRAYRKPTK
jgi:high-affinity iron transporter